MPTKLEITKADMVVTNECRLTTDHKYGVKANRNRLRDAFAQALEDYRKELAKVAKDHGHDFHVQIKKLRVKDFTNKRSYGETMSALSQTYLECDCIAKAIKTYGEEKQ